MGKMTIHADGGFDDESTLRMLLHIVSLAALRSTSLLQEESKIITTILSRNEGMLHHETESALRRLVENAPEADMRSPYEVWPGMDQKHAFLLWMMGWRPYEFDHAIASAQCSIMSEVGQATVNLPSGALRDAARALEEAASWLERRKLQDHREEA